MALQQHPTSWRWEYRCDACERLLGTLRTGINVQSAGYVTTVGKVGEGWRCGDDGGCTAPIEHPLACSDACEERLAREWSAVSLDDVDPEDWGPEFHDADAWSPAMTDAP